MLRIEVFDWTLPDEQTTISWQVTAMQLAMHSGRLKYKSVLAQLDPTFAREWLIKRELNMNYVRSLKSPRLREPVLGACMPDKDKTVVLIDGSHRYYRRYLDGCTVVPYRLILPEDWLPYAEIKGQWPCN